MSTSLREAISAEDLHYPEDLPVVARKDDIAAGLGQARRGAPPGPVRGHPDGGRSVAAARRALVPRPLPQLDRSP